MDVDDAVGVNVEGDLDLRDAAGRGGDTNQLELTWNGDRLVLKNIYVKKTRFVCFVGGLGEYKSSFWVRSTCGVKYKIELTWKEGLGKQINLLFTLKQIKCIDYCLAHR